MPNTLVHYGIQGLASRVAAPRLDPRWILWACVLPDLPWILQRILRLTPLDPYLIRGVAIVQASLCGCLLLAAACALLARRPVAIFTLLGLNAAGHLLLDGLERKWGNGVHFLVPFDWTLWNGGLVWPEHPAIAALTVAGFVVGLWLAWPASPLRRNRRNTARYGLAAVCLVAYVGVPVWWHAAPREHDNHSLGVLTATADRPGRPVAFDRNRMRGAGTGVVLQTFAGETLNVAPSALLATSAYAPATANNPGVTVSLEGRFQSPDTIAIDRLHAHHSMGLRDTASIVGLTILLFSLVIPAWRRRAAEVQSSSP